MKHCDENCLSCSFDKCLDEMTDRERRVALGKDYAGRGKKKTVGNRRSRGSHY